MTSNRYLADILDNERLVAFVDRIVSEHGGSVTVGDAPKGGALFEVRLPLEGP